jgi:hypothetical protein
MWRGLLGDDFGDRAAIGDVDETVRAKPETQQKAVPARLSFLEWR